MQTYEVRLGWYLTFIEFVGTNNNSFDVHYKDENIYLTQKC